MIISMRWRKATSTRMRMTPETSATATSARATAEGGVRRNIYASPVFRTPYRGPPGSLGMTPATASSAVYSLPRRPTDVNRLGIGIAPLSRVSVTPMRGSFAIAPAEPSSSTSHTPAVPSDADLDYCVKTQSSQTGRSVVSCCAHTAMLTPSCHVDVNCRNASCNSY